MGSWTSDDGDDYEWPDPTVTVEETDNPVTAELLDYRGDVIRQWRARRPPGFR